MPNGIKVNYTWIVNENNWKENDYYKLSAEKEQCRKPVVFYKLKNTFTKGRKEEEGKREIFLWQNRKRETGAKFYPIRRISLYSRDIY